MTNYGCPRCGNKTIGFWQKQLAGIPSVVTCAQCGARLSAPLVSTVLIRSAALFFPCMMVFFGYLFVPFSISGRFPESEVGLYLAFAVGAALGCALAIWVTHRFVPLVPKDT